MRTLIGIILFIAVGLGAAVLVGFRPAMSGEPLPADQEQSGLTDHIVLKFNHVVAENTPKGLAAERFAQLARERTDGRVEVQVFPDGTLFSDNDELAALQRGDIQMIAPAFSKLSGVVPAWQALDLPFAFADQQAVDDALSGEIGRRLFATLPSKGIRGLAFWDNGFKMMTSSRNPLLWPDDFRGQRFRVMPSRVLVSQFEQLGAKALPLQFTEVYRNLEPGVLDGQENTLSNIATRRLYQVQKYLTLSNHGYLAYAVVVDDRFWSRLPDDIRAALESAMRETTEWMNALAVAKNDEALRQIRETGMRIDTLTPEMRSAWIRALDPLYEQYARDIGKELMDLIRKQRR